MRGTPELLKRGRSHCYAETTHSYATIHQQCKQTNGNQGAQSFLPHFKNHQPPLIYIYIYNMIFYLLPRHLTRCICVCMQLLIFWEMRENIRRAGFWQTLIKETRLDQRPRGHAAHCSSCLVPPTLWLCFYYQWIECSAAVWKTLIFSSF